MKEESIYLQVANYMRHQYPAIIFRFDYGAGLKLTMGQAVKQKKMQSGRAYPDLFIAKPKTDRKECGEGTVCFTHYHGLFLELKREGVKLKRDKDAKKVLQGELKLRKAGDWFDQHTEEQADMLLQLRMLGYEAQFAVGFDDAKRIIDKYLSFNRIGSGYPTNTMSDELEKKDAAADGGQSEQTNAISEQPAVTTPTEEAPAAETETPSVEETQPSAEEEKSASPSDEGKPSE